LGREVVRLVDEQQEVGEYLKTFIAGALSSGVYFYRLESTVDAQMRAMVLLR
jgi:hypothetical protein